MDPILFAAAGYLAKGIIEGVVEGAGKVAVSALRRGPANNDKVLAATLAEVDEGRGDQVNVAVLTELIRSHAESDSELAGLLREALTEATVNQSGDVTTGSGTSTVQSSVQSSKQSNVFGSQTNTQSSFGGGSGADPKA